MSLQQLASPLLHVQSSKFMTTPRNRSKPLSMPPNSSGEGKSKTDARQGSYQNTHSPEIVSPTTVTTGTSNADLEETQGSRASGVHLLLNPPISPSRRSQDSPFSATISKFKGDHHASDTFLPAESGLQDPFLDNRKPKHLQSQTAVHPRRTEIEGGERDKTQHSELQGTRPSLPRPPGASLAATASIRTQRSTWQDERTYRYTPDLQESKESQAHLWRTNLPDYTDIGQSTRKYAAPASPMDNISHEHVRALVDSVPLSSRLLEMQSGQGLLNIPVDFQAASASADEKRKRNAVASARFRARRRERERADSREIEELKQEIQNLTEDAEFYRSERDNLSLVVQHLPDRERYFPRPISPRHFRSQQQQPMSISRSSSHHTTATAAAVEKQSRERSPTSSEGQELRKRARHTQSAVSSLSGAPYPEVASGPQMQPEPYNFGDYAAAGISANSTFTSPTSLVSASPLGSTAPSSSTTFPPSTHSTASSPTFLPPIMTESFALTYDQQLRQQQRRTRQRRETQSKRGKGDRSAHDS